MQKPDRLIRTKLRPPFTRPSLVGRPRLLAQLAEGLKGPLTLITAPAGFGKTTLLASCMASCGVRGAWVSLDKGDNPVGRFLSYLTVALQGLDAAIGDESASESMLKRMKRGYTVQQVREALETLSRSKIAFGVSLMLGAPGETPETIAETLRVVDDYEIPNGVWVTIGVYLWTELQDIVTEARRSGALKDEAELFSGAVYLSPDLPRAYLQELPDALRARRGYTVQFNKPSEAWAL